MTFFGTAQSASNYCAKLPSTLGCNDNRWFIPKVPGTTFLGKTSRYLSSHFRYLHMGVSKNRGIYPQIIHFNRGFHYKPSILGGLPPLFLETSMKKYHRQSWMRFWRGVGHDDFIFLEPGNWFRDEHFMPGTQMGPLVWLEKALFWGVGSLQK